MKDSNVLKYSPLCLDHIRNQRRTRLSARHIEDLLRIRCNGPSDITKFDAGKYAKHWLKKHQDTGDPRGLRLPQQQESVDDIRIETPIDDEDAELEEEANELHVEREILQRRKMKHGVLPRSTLF